MKVTTAGEFCSWTSGRAIADRLLPRQFNFGWEICDTGGKSRTFTVHSLTPDQKF